MDLRRSGVRKDFGRRFSLVVLSTVFADRTFGPTSQDRIWEIQSQVITELAEKEACVIVGRCADQTDQRYRTDTGLE